MDFLLDIRGRQRIKSVLLLYFFVGRTIGNCPQPVLKENIVLSNEALLLNEFLDNTEISLECPNGYIQDRGPGTIKCINGTWSDSALTCKKKDCGQPEIQPNMKLNISQGTLFGAVVSILCDKGYRITGSRFKQCYSKGWSGRGSCNIVTCHKPVEVTNGRSLWVSDNFPKYGESVQYVCDEGYTLVGKDTLVCTEKGVYDSTLPLCKGDVFATKTATPTSTPPAQDLQDITTSKREQTPTPSATPTFSLSAQEEHFGIIDMDKDFEYTPVIISVVCVTLVVCIAVFFIHKLLLKRKGSYDTREDLKPELLQFQNL